MLKINTLLFFNFLQLNIQSVACLNIILVGEFHHLGFGFVPNLKLQINNPNPIVLEIGPGKGELLDKIISIYKHENVYAMQPLNEEYSSHNDTIKSILNDKFIEDSLEEYYKKPDPLNFDIIFIYKWNISIALVDEFIIGLKTILKEDGIIYITSVEKGRFHKRDGYIPYIKDKMKEYFNVKTSIENVGTHEYGVVELTHKI